MKSGTLSKLALGGLLAVGVGALAPKAHATPTPSYNLSPSSEFIYVQVAGTSSSILVPQQATAGSWITPFYVGTLSGSTYIYAPGYTGSNAIAGLATVKPSGGTDYYEISGTSMYNIVSTGPSVASNYDLVSGSTTNVLGLGSGTSLLPTLSIFTAANGFLTPPPKAILSNQVSSSSHLGIGLSASATLSSISCMLDNSSPANYTCANPLSVVIGTTPQSTENFGSPQSSNQTSLLLTSFATPFDLANTTTVDLLPGDNMITTVTTTLQSVPEPFSMSLMAVGLVGLTIVYRRRSRA